MYPETIHMIRLKQISRIVLAKEAEMITKMVNEGLLTTKAADIFFEEIHEDVEAIEKERNSMYRQQGELNAKKFEDRKFLTVESILQSSNDCNMNSPIASSSYDYIPLNRNE